MLKVQNGADTIPSKTDYDSTVRTFVLPLQREITQLQKLMVSFFPSAAADFVHQQDNIQVGTIRNALEKKL